MIKPIENKTTWRWKKSMFQETTKSAVLMTLTVAVSCIFGSCDAHHESNRSLVRKTRGDEAGLPGDVTPERYQLQLLPLLDEGEFSGEVIVTLTCLSATQTLTLHSRHLTIGTPDLTVTESVSRAQVAVTQHGHVHESEFYRVELAADLEPGKRYDVWIKFSGKMSESSGIFRSTYVDNESGENRWVAGANFKNKNARRGFPCFDEPAMKAKFSVKIGRKESMKSISNLPLKSSQPIDEKAGWVWDDFEESPPMSPYLVSFLVSDFEALDAGQGPTTIRVWARKDILSQYETYLEHTKQTILLYEDVFGVFFPLRKLDLVLIPGLVENTIGNWGLIMFGENQLNQANIKIEVFSQWFGGQVTPHSWTDQQFVIALQIYITAFTAQNSGIRQSFDNMITRKNALYYEYSKYEPWARFGSSFGHWDASRVALIMMMFNMTLSPSTFQKTLTKILTDRKQQTFSTDDFWDTLSEQAHSDNTAPTDLNIREVAKGWSKWYRFPVVSVTRDYAAGRASLSQKVFVKDAVKNIEGKDEMMWTIPIVYTTQDMLDFQDSKPETWMKKKEGEILPNLPGAGKWIIVNFQEIGMFYVNYDRENWRMLANYLDSDNMDLIPARTRASLLHNAVNLAQGDELGYDVCLDVTRFLSREDEYPPWMAASAMFDHLGRQIDGTSAWEKFRQYALKLMTARYESLSHQSSTNRYVVSSIWYKLCTFGYKPCLDSKYSEYQKWMDSSNPDGDPVPERAICTVYEWGTREQWEFGLERYKNWKGWDMSRSRVYFLKVLAGCARDEWKIQRMLNHSLYGEPAFSDYELRVIFIALTSNAPCYTTLFSHLRGNWNQWKARMSGNGELWKTLIGNAAGMLRTPEQQQKLKEFYEERKDEFGEAKSTIEWEMVETEGRVKWVQTNVPEIESWLDKYLS